MIEAGSIRIKKGVKVTNVSVRYIQRRMN